MNKEYFRLRSLTSDFSKQIKIHPVASCHSCNSEVNFEDLIEIKGLVGCVICLR